MHKSAYMLFALISNIFASSLSQEFSEVIGEYFEKNEKLKVLEYEIKALQSQAKAQAKWDSPKLSIGINSAEVPTPLNLSANQMQNIAISIGGNLDLNQKRQIQAQITFNTSRIKLLELKALKDQYILTLLTQSINAQKNEQLLSFTQEAIKNLDILIAALHSSSNFNPLQIHKLNLLKAKLTLKQNDISNQLQNAHIALSQASFEHHFSFSPPTPSSEDIAFVQSPQFLSQLLEDNYEAQIAILSTKNAQDSLKLAKKSYLGDIALNGSYMFREHYPDMFSLSFSLPLPIYGKEKQLVHAKNYTYLSNKSDITQVQNKLKHTAQSLLAQIANLEANYQLIDTIALPSNHKITSLYKHHSTSQNAAFFEFYNALNDEIDTEILRLETLASLHIAYWNLRALRGERD